MHESTDIAFIRRVVKQQLSLQDDVQSLDLTRVTGGGNNRAYVFTHNAKKFFVKQYYRDQLDTRDRLGTEYAFASFLWAQGIHCNPQPLAIDEVHGIGIYTYLEGERFAGRTIADNEIHQALDFILAMNQDRSSPRARRLPNASEACFSLADHIQLIDKRIRNLQGIPINDAVDQQAETFIKKQLIPYWQEIKEKLQADTQDITMELSIEDRILSPSDFGFHNAILNHKQQVMFFDFEYAGWDDPAKLVCDFFCQPAIPVNFSYFSIFAEKIASLTNASSFTLDRCVRLLAIFQIKWCCIFLNCFVPAFYQRKKFSGSVSREQKAAQLNKAVYILENQTI